MLPFNLWSSASIGCLSLTLIIIIMDLLTNVDSIDCFKCVSYNGANKACDDPFHNNFSTALLESPCMGGRKGRDGLFPATACIKIAGYYDDTGETITVRGCALDSGTLTTDTEIIRMSHCGKFYYDERYVHGCLQSCSDADACNAVSSIHALSTISGVQCVTVTGIVIGLIKWRRLIDRAAAGVEFMVGKSRLPRPQRTRSLQTFDSLTARSNKL